MHVVRHNAHHRAHDAVVHTLIGFDKQGSGFVGMAVVAAVNDDACALNASQAVVRLARRQQQSSQ